MERQTILGILRAHRQELNDAGIVHLHLFGSVARGEASPDSDIDLMADLSERRYSLLGMVHLENRLADILGGKVELSPANSMKAPVRERALSESVLAF